MRMYDHQETGSITFSATRFTSRVAMFFFYWRLGFRPWKCKETAEQKALRMRGEK